jgi:hypothetical protein
MKKTICFLFLVVWAALPAAASAAKAEARVSANVKLLVSLGSLPHEVDLAVRAGASEEEIGRTLKKMKEDKVEGEAAVEVARHFRRQAEERTSDKGLSDVVHACLAQGKRGTELVACVHDDWDKKPKVKKGEEGKPDEAGKAEDKGKIEDKGKDKGKLEGKAEDKDKDKGKDKPEDKGKGKGGH